MLKLGWRNIWRNRRRTLISMSAVALGLALVLIYGSIVKRMLGDAKNQLDNTGMGHVEISAEGWRARRPVARSMSDARAVIARLHLPAGAEVGARSLSRGLLTSAHGNEAVEVHGVSWSDELKLSDYARHVTTGALPAEDDAAGIVIGDELATRMQLQVGHKVRLMAQRSDGEMGAQLFRVRGIYHSLAAKISERRVLVSQAAFAEMVGVDVNSAHQIVIQLDPTSARAIADGAKRDLGTGYEVLTYAEIFPMFATMEQLMDSVQIFMALFVYLLVGLGILNTMLMSVLERTRELGVMQALGTRPSGVVAMVLAETFWIATLSIAVGVLVGVGVNWWGSSGLIDYSQEMGEGIEMGGAVMRASFATQLSLADTIGPVVFVYVMALVVGALAALRVARMPIVAALRARQ
jgi:putative ABC transport system permease protein